MNREIRILMHTHWDREWYFTKDETKVLLRNHMQEVMEFLEGHPDTIYILDGQSVMIDDYLELEPEAEPRLKQLVEKGNLRVGPWYTQTDLLLVHGESVFRNLYYGIKRAEEFGEPMLVGYAPDTFGHASQMPQIYKQFGIESTFFWRGFSELKAEKSDFLWKGVDGSEIVGVNLATGYQGAKYLEEEPQGLSQRMKKIMSVLDNYSASNARLIMNGHDQMPVQKNIHHVMENIKQIYPEDTVMISDFESYVDQLDRDDLEVVTGELTDSKHARIHRTIGSTRMDIKLLNTDIENNLYNVLEPLAVIGEQAGIPYPHGVIEKVSKILFGTHAHDSIGGCNSDKVNQDIKQRLLNAKEMVDTQIELHLRLMTLGNKETGNTIVVVNPLPEKRSNQFVELDMLTRTKGFRIFDHNKEEIGYSVVSQDQEDAGLIDRQVAARLLDIKVYRTKIVLPVNEIEGLSARYLTFEEVDAEKEEAIRKSDESIYNTYGQLFVEDNVLCYKNEQTQAVYSNILSLENSGDAGDSYDYSPPVNDWVLNSKDCGRMAVEVVKEKHYQEMLINWELDVPENKVLREKKEANLKVDFQVKLRLYPNDPKVYVTMNHVNKTEHNRYRAVFKTGVQTDEVKVDGYMSTQTKPVYNEKPLSIWEKDKWAEKPVSIETAQSFISLKDKEAAFTVYSKGLKEYEVLDDAIHLTLFRTFSHLGQRELVNRPGRPSGIEIETPDNQLIDEPFTFHFAFEVAHGHSEESHSAKAYLTPLVGYQLKEFNRFNINPSNTVGKTSFKLSLELSGLVVSSTRLTAENELFVRLFNPHNEEVTIPLPKGTFKATPMERKEEEVNRLILASQEIGNIIVQN
ncbi:mannosylglycerate hydrolase [Alkalibacterium putridalgicola]|uniref:Alpha-mannosidase n=1 Tax=Alkalibacterium putridalgicola TaxID=426703 RepID=A0A1H7WUY7_9LACT|nr:glycoside hydrolase family 38 C-terminal domain-containing protein [Alkalibacterium putridalgicola]GEK90243.1 alpha-mannosidase [Alkalibacterium putridalgicola]SEM25376.1 mannosylglycerate hydrolase [Alkalibacterium putridalgicola]